jgi:hypothetical protein
MAATPLPPRQPLTARQLAELYLGAPFRVQVRESTVTVNTTGVQLVGPNPMRIGLLVIFGAGAQATIFVAHSLDQLATAGRAVSYVDDGRFSLTEDLDEVCEPLFGKVAVGTQDVYVRELISA